MNATVPLLTATGRARLLARCVAVASVGLVAVAVSPVLMSHELLGWGVGFWGRGFGRIGGLRFETHCLSPVQDAVAAVRTG